MEIAYVIDADALLCVRSLGLFPVLRRAEKLPRPVVVTEYVARHELYTIDKEIRDLEAIEVLRVEALIRRDSNFRRLRDEGADKGEAEAIAWTMTRPENGRPMFVSLDVEARRYATKNRVPCGDVMDFLSDLLERGVLSLVEAEALTAPWLDRKQQRGRPPDFTTFAETLARRQAARGGR